MAAQAMEVGPVAMASWPTRGPAARWGVEATEVELLLQMPWVRPQEPRAGATTLAQPQVNWPPLAAAARLAGAGSTRVGSILQTQTMLYPTPPVLTKSPSRHSVNLMMLRAVGRFVGVGSKGVGPTRIHSAVLRVEALDSSKPRHLTSLTQPSGRIRIAWWGPSARHRPR
ncbi:MAG: hypothetical protein ABSB36_09910 [Candidatus Dormibacteria bacterium]|jgi:hypothetical protein